MQGVSSVQLRNVLSNEQIHAGQTTEGIAKGTHDPRPSRNRASRYPGNGLSHDPDLRVGHCRALTCLRLGS